MRTEEEIQEKIKELDQRLKETDSDYKHVIATTEAQKYILDWVLGSSQ
jgi:hypothetical protein